MILIREDQHGTINLERHPTLRSFPVRKVRGGLWLGECKLLRSLPEVLEVGGYLDLSVCHSLTELPTTLRVGGNLWVRDTAVSELPEDLVVGWSFWLQGRKPHTFPKVLKLGGMSLGWRKRDTDR